MEYEGRKGRDGKTGEDYLRNKISSKNGPKWRK
jgi:hypothetical protein